ncbi:hypothetical protein JCM21900_005155 [Sporobolomyces salmonicolor]
MSASHPLAPRILPTCRRFPEQASALFQAFVDLSLAQQWRDLEVLELDHCRCAVLRGRPKTPAKSPPAVVLPMGLQTPTTLASLSSVLTALDSLPPHSTASPFSDPPASTEPPTVYLAIVEKDGSIVYYVLRQGIVSPKEVPE